MSLLVTGAMGYVGSGIKAIASEIVGVDRVSGSNFQACISDFKILSNVDTVIHLADRRLNELDQNNWLENIELHTKFIRALENHRSLKKIIFSSSCSVYGHQEELLDESSPVMATSWYAKSKVRVEQLLKESSLPYVICRFGTAYGASPPMRWDLFPNFIGRQILEDQSIDIYDPESLRPYVHVADMRRGLLFAAQKAPVRAVLNFAGENLSKNNLLQLVSSALQKSPKNVIYNMDKKESRNYSVSSKTVEELGFTFKHNLRSEYSKWKDKVWNELS